jgi:hypothetical protein
VLALSGVLLFVPSADRYAASPIFWLKLGAIAVGGLNALAFHLTAWRHVDAWSLRPRPGWTVRGAAIGSIIVWVVVIALGRGMGYESRQPPPSDLDLNLDLFSAPD